jgi:acyl dehydratase
MPLTRKIYYSGLQVGDEIPAWQSPPLDRIQIARYAGAAGDYNPLIVDEPFARAAGFRSIISPGALALGGLSQMLTEWLKGPFLRRLHAKFLKIMWPGDILTCRGRVTSKHREGTDYRVEFDLWIENQDGEMVVRGTGTASLFHSAQDESQRLAGGPPLIVDDPPAPSDAGSTKPAAKPAKVKPKR